MSTHRTWHSLATPLNKRIDLCYNLTMRNGTQTGDWYQRLRARVRAAFGTALGFVVDGFLAPTDTLHLVLRLLADGRVPRGSRMKFLLLCVYIASPWDVVPEFILGPVGVLDDALLTLYWTAHLLRAAGRDAVEAYWAGGRLHLAVLLKGLRLAELRTGVPKRTTG